MRPRGAHPSSTPRREPPVSCGSVRELRLDLLLVFTITSACHYLPDADQHAAEPPATVEPDGEGARSALTVVGTAGCRRGGAGLRCGPATKADDRVHLAAAEC